MFVSGTNFSGFMPRAMRNWSDRGVAITLSCALVVALIFVVWHLDVGVDVSDQAYAIISVDRFNEAKVQVTLFGHVWAALSPFQSIIANRYLALLVLLLSTLALSLSAMRYLGAVTIWSSASLILIASSLSGSLVFFYVWMPDPSYNLVSYCGIATIWAVLFVQCSCQSGTAKERPASFCYWSKWTGLIAGFAAAALLLSKAPTALALGLQVLLTVLWLERIGDRLAFLRSLVLYWGAGASLLFMVLAFQGTMPEDIFEIMSNGYEATRLLEGHTLDPIDYLWTFFRSMLAYRAVQISAILSGVMLAISVYSGIKHRSDTSYLPTFAGLTIAFGIFVVIVVFLWFRNPPFVVLNAINAMLVVSAFIAIFILDSYLRNRALILFSMLCISNVSYAYGSNVPLDQLGPGASGLLAVASGVIILALKGPTRDLFRFPFFACILSLLITTIFAANSAPYRLTGPLVAANTYVSVGPYGDRMRVPDDLVPFYQRLDMVARKVRKTGKSPVVIDMSGRTPMVAYQTGLRTVGTPWLLSGYPGSDQLFDFVVGKSDASPLNQSWVFQADAYPGRFDAGLLKAHGVEFPADYVAIAHVPIPYMDTFGTLYAPRPRLGQGKQLAR